MPDAPSPSHAPNHRCERCGHLHRAPANPWRAALPLAWTVSLGLVGVGIALGPAIMFALPLIMASGFGLIAAVHERAGRDVLCSHCGAAMTSIGPRAVRTGRRASESVASGSFAAGVSQP